MMRKFVLVILLATISTGVMALGLGNIELNSGLNQPFDARIELLSPTASELDNLTITLADTEAFERAGIERLFVLSSLRFAVQISESGKDYIHITTQDVMREPFLNFLIDASWSNGRLFREYTVLLDPPLYDPNAHRSAQVQTTSPAAASSSVEPLGSGTQPTTAGEQTVSNFSGNEVGPTAASDTLWSLANRVKPDSTISVNQMMVALLRANPEAFIGNNINGLKQGQILRVPAIEDITSTSFAAAIEEVRSQNAMWEEVRGTLATDTAARPVSTSVETAQGSSETQSSQTGSELRLLAASNESANTSGSSTGAATGNNSEANSGLMSEQLESVTSENADLRDRLNESDTIIQDLKRLIQLKDDELATLQKQMGGTGVAPTPAEAVKVSTDESLLDQILSFIFVNIIVVGGGLGGVILLAVVASFIRKRKAAAANDPEVSALTEFPDFETPADASGNDGPQIEAYKEAPAAADKLEATIDVPIVSSAPAQQDVADDNALDFDIGGLSAETPAEEEGSLELGSSDENLIDFDDQSVSSDTDGGIELDLGTGDSAEEGSLELSMDTDSKDGDSGLELDFGLLDSDTKDNDGGLELDFDSVEEVSSTNVIDLESTVKVPKGGALSLDSDDDDDDDDHTVLVPRTNDAGEQSAEDENATKLDLAKAYVELGDESNAKSILEEVIAEGSPAQRRQAQELMSQIS